MFDFLNTGARRRFIALLTIVSICVVAAYASTPASTYDVELVVSQGKKSVETDADIMFDEASFKVVPDKTSFQSSTKVFKYSDIKNADHSYSKKPMLSGGGAIATALLVGFIVAIPFLFIKKKKHWMTVRTENDYAVIKLGDNNYRQIVAEFETHGVKVADLKEQDK